MPDYPGHLFTGTWIDYETPLNATNLNQRDDEIRAIENALGLDLVETGTVSLSEHLKIVGSNVLMAFNGGNVGIGTETPGAKLQVHGTNACVAVSEPGSDTDVFKVTNDGNACFGFRLDANENFEIILDKPGVGFVPRLHIDRSTTDGYVGIGTTNPAQRLHVAGTACVSDSLGIGTTTPSASLDVRGQVLTQNWLCINNSAQSAALVGDGRAAIAFGANNQPNAWYFGAVDNTNWSNTAMGLWSWKLDRWVQTWTPAGAVTINAEFNHLGSTLGFFGATPKTKPDVSGSPGGNVALMNLLAKLHDLGLINNVTTE